MDLAQEQKYKKKIIIGYFVQTTNQTSSATVHISSWVLRLEERAKEGGCQQPKEFSEGGGRGVGGRYQTTAT